MSRFPSRFSWAFSAALGLSVLGCGANFRNAIVQGDTLAQQGNWDAAAASYEVAVDLEPNAKEAHIKLRATQRQQALARTAASCRHLANGELSLALEISHEAMVLDPQSIEARAAYDNARHRSIVRIEGLIGEGKLQAALALTANLRRVDPQDTRATELEGRCLDRLASGAYDNAMAYVAQKKLGNAVLAFNEAERVRPGYRDAHSRAAELRATLEDEIQFVLHVDRARNSERNSLTTRVEKSLLRWEPEARFRLVATTDQTPAGGTQAVRVSPRLNTISREHSMTPESRSCEYVCGVDRVANPAHEATKERVAEAERRMRRAESEMDQATRQVFRAKQDTKAAAAVLRLMETHEQSAEREWVTCRKNQKVGGYACSAERDRFVRAAGEQKLAASRDTQAKATLARIEGEVSETKKNVSRSHMHWEQTLRVLSTTPTMIDVDRFCPHNYGVETHVFTFSTALSLTAQVMGTASPISMPPKALQVTAMDETFVAFPGRCVQVAAGDPLNVPSDVYVEETLARRAVEQIRDQVAVWYTVYAESYKADEDSAKAAGRVEDANEAFVRYRLLKSGSL